MKTFLDAPATRATFVPRRLEGLWRALRPRVAAALLLTVGSASAQDAWVNWESPHVHPLDSIPDGTRLLAVDTVGHRLAVFDLRGDAPRLEFEVPVGLDPVSVRAESNRRAWVVERISDAISVVDLTTGNVVASLATDDEPADVVFAGEPRRAYVSCSQSNALLVFDPTRLDAPPVRIAIDGEDPRALAVSKDGRQVYAAIFASGNDTTVLGGGALFNIDFPPNVVNRRVGPFGGRNPPPNVRPDDVRPDDVRGDAVRSEGAREGQGRSARAVGPFDPPATADAPPPPRVGLIVRREMTGRWLDDTGGDWTHVVGGPSAALSGRPVGWELTDNDVAIVDTRTHAVRYARHLMNACMALAVHPTSGDVTLVGTDATNEIRFEPRLRGKFLRVETARVRPSDGTSRVTDLNPHLEYRSSTVPPADRRRSIGDPRAVAWNSAGTRALVAGMGSDNVVALDADGTRDTSVAPVRVGAGPTGIVFDAARERWYVLCRFDNTVVALDARSLATVARVELFDPTPLAVRAGRARLYGTSENSGLGQVACASCHVDARLDHLGWDLGDPAGSVAPLADANLAARIPALLASDVPGRGPFEPYHPMKGPMTTQTLQDVVGHEPLHWRGDRAGIEAFAGAFVTLQGKDTPPSASEMSELEAFLATITVPPNPYRDADNALPESLALPGHFTTGRFGPAGQPLPPGHPRRGLERFRTGKLDNHKVECVTCHTLPTGYGTDLQLVDGEFRPTPIGPNGERHHVLVSQDGSTNVTMKVPQLRNLYDKVGFDLTRTRNHFGFGFLHDGTVDSLARFVNEAAFTLESDQDTADMVAFLLAFSGSDLPSGSVGDVDEPPGPPSKDTHAAVGRHVTVASPPDAAQRAWLEQSIASARARRVGLVVHGRRAGLARGWVRADDGRFQSDRRAEIATLDELLEGATAGGELTFLIVPFESRSRCGVDRDADGIFDRDELDHGDDPADPAVAPTNAGRGARDER